MNYFHYFSEIEDRFSRRRGSILLLNTLDWALIETWREAGVPLEAVLRGIDDAFDKHDARAAKSKSGLRKVNGLAWCAQAVMQAAETMVEASTCLAPTTPREPRESGFESNRIATYLDRLADTIAKTGAPHLASEMWMSVAATTSNRLRALATTMRSGSPIPLDDLDRTLTVLEEKLLTTLQATATEQELVDLKSQADRELAPYRSRISAVQLRQIQQQFLHKRLLELRGLPRLSLFYMGHGE
jgi:hypothetical protein